MIALSHLMDHNKSNSPVQDDPGGGITVTIAVMLSTLVGKSTRVASSGGNL